MKQTGKISKRIIILIAFLASVGFVWQQFVAAEIEPCNAGGFWDESTDVCVYPENTRSASENKQ